jgi:hypothetical protein
VLIQQIKWEANLFFSEEKKQKTFDLRRSHAACHGRRVTASAGLKVVSFSSSEKNDLAFHLRLNV